jgi:hypothetical protein
MSKDEILLKTLFGKLALDKEASVQEEPLKRKTDSEPLEIVSGEFARGVRVLGNVIGPSLMAQNGGGSPPPHPYKHRRLVQQIALFGGDVRAEGTEGTGNPGSNVFETGGVTVDHLSPGSEDLILLIDGNNQLEVRTFQVNDASGTNLLLNNSVQVAASSATWSVYNPNPCRLFPASSENPGSETTYLTVVPENWPVISTRLSEDNGGRSTKASYTLESDYNGSTDSTGERPIVDIDNTSGSNYFSTGDFISFETPYNTGFNNKPLVVRSSNLSGGVETLTLTPFYDTNIELMNSNTLDSSSTSVHKLRTVSDLFDNIDSTISAQGLLGTNNFSPKDSNALDSVRMKPLVDPSRLQSLSGGGFESGSAESFMKEETGEASDDHGVGLVLFPADGSGRPDLSNPIHNFENVTIDSSVDEEQFIHVDHSEGAIHLSHPIAAGDDLNPNSYTDGTGRPRLFATFAVHNGPNAHSSSKEISKDWDEIGGRSNENSSAYFSGGEGEWPVESEKGFVVNLEEGEDVGYHPSPNDPSAGGSRKSKSISEGGDNSKISDLGIEELYQYRDKVSGRYTLAASGFGQLPSPPLGSELDRENQFFFIPDAVESYRTFPDDKAPSLGVRGLHSFRIRKGRPEVRSKIADFVFASAETLSGWLNEYEFNISVAQGVYTAEDMASFLRTELQDDTNYPNGSPGYSDGGVDFEIVVESNSTNSRIILLADRFLYIDPNAPANTTIGFGTGVIQPDELDLTLGRGDQVASNMNWRTSIASKGPDSLRSGLVFDQDIQWRSQDGGTSLSELADLTDNVAASGEYTKDPPTIDGYYYSETSDNSGSFSFSSDQFEFLYDPNGSSTSVSVNLDGTLTVAEVVDEIQTAATNAGLFVGKLVGISTNELEVTANSSGKIVMRSRDLIQIGSETANSILGFTDNEEFNQNLLHLSSGSVYQTSELNGSSNQELVKQTEEQLVSGESLLDDSGRIGPYMLRWDPDPAVSSFVIEDAGDDSGNNFDPRKGSDLYLLYEDGSTASFDGNELDVHQNLVQHENDIYTVGPNRGRFDSLEACLEYIDLIVKQQNFTNHFEGHFEVRILEDITVNQTMNLPPGVTIKGYGHRITVDDLGTTDRVFQVAPFNQYSSVSRDNVVYHHRVQDLNFVAGTDDSGNNVTPGVLFYVEKVGKNDESPETENHGNFVQLDNIYVTSNLSGYTIRTFLEADTTQDIGTAVAVGSQLMEVTNCELQCASYPFSLTGVREMKIENVLSDRGTVFLENTKRVTFKNCHFETSSGDTVTVSNGGSFKAEDCIFRNTSENSTNKVINIFPDKVPSSDLHIRTVFNNCKIHATDSGVDSQSARAFEVYATQSSQIPIENTEIIANDCKIGARDRSLLGTSATLGKSSRIRFNNCKAVTGLSMVGSTTQGEEPVLELIDTEFGPADGEFASGNTMDVTTGVGASNAFLAGVHCSNTEVRMSGFKYQYELAFGSTAYELPVPSNGFSFSKSDIRLDNCFGTIENSYFQSAFDEKLMEDDSPHAIVRVTGEINNRPVKVSNVEVDQSNTSNANNLGIHLSPNGNGITPDHASISDINLRGDVNGTEIQNHIYYRKEVGSDTIEVEYIDDGSTLSSSVTNPGSSTTRIEVTFGDTTVSYSDLKSEIESNSEANKLVGLNSLGIGDVSDTGGPIAIDDTSSMGGIRIGNKDDSANRVNKQMINGINTANYKVLSYGNTQNENVGLAILSSNSSDIVADGAVIESGTTKGTESIQSDLQIQITPPGESPSAGHSTLTQSAIVIFQN